MAFFEPETPPAPPGEAIAVNGAVDEEKCWRCGLWVRHLEGFCPICRAPLYRKLRERNHPDVNRDRIREATHEARSIKILLIFFGIYLGTSILQAWWFAFFPHIAELPKEKLERAYFIQILSFEGIDTLLVAVAIWVVGATPALPRDRSRILGWFLGVPILALILAVNFGYGMFLEALIDKQKHAGEAVGFKQYPWIGVLIMCVQPGLIEEMFFRYLALGHLRKVMSDHEAVWVSGVMFGLAHIHAPLSMPALILAGVGLGYARVLSGSLVLPMGLHALHNAIVTLAGE